MAGGNGNLTGMAGVAQQGSRNHAQMHVGRKWERLHYGSVRRLRLVVP